MTTISHVHEKHDGPPSGVRLLVNELRQDARFHHELRHAGRPVTATAIARIALGSRGLLLLGTHRVVKAIASSADAQPARRLRRRALRTLAAVLDDCVQILTKSEVRATADLAPGIYLSDRGNVILGAREVGRGTVIHHRVTIGRSMVTAGTPALGERVWIGPDSLLVGEIHVGNGATILPGTVLTRSIPAGTVVQGNPARIVRRGFDNSELRRTLAIHPSLPPRDTELTCSPT